MEIENLPQMLKNNRTFADNDAIMIDKRYTVSLMDSYKKMCVILVFLYFWFRVTKLFLKKCLCSIFCEKIINIVYFFVYTTK